MRAWCSRSHHFPDPLGNETAGAKTKSKKERIFRSFFFCCARQINCSLWHWRGSALAFSRGEGGRASARSDVVVCEAAFGYHHGQKVPYTTSVICSYLANASFSSRRSLWRRIAALGGLRASRPTPICSTERQTPIDLPLGQLRNIEKIIKTLLTIT